MRARYGIATLATVLAFGAAACAGASGGTGPGSAPSEPVTAASAEPAGPSATGAAGAVPAGLVDPCGLLTTAQVRTIVGGVASDGVRDPEEDGTYVSCMWRNDAAHRIGDIDAAPPLVVTLWVRTAEFDAKLKGGLGSGNLEAVSGTGADLAAVTSADLGTIGVAGGGVAKGSVYATVRCWTPQVSDGTPKTSKASCTDAVRAVAAALP